MRFKGGLGLGMIGVVALSVLAAGPAVIDFVEAGFSPSAAPDDGVDEVDDDVAPDAVVTGEVAHDTSEGALSEDDAATSDADDPDADAATDAAGAEGGAEDGSEADGSSTPEDGSEGELQGDGGELEPGAAPDAQGGTVVSGAIEYREGSEAREVELPASGGQLARVEVFQDANYAVRLVFVGYEDVALWWLTPSEALMSMTVHRYPQRILEERHDVPTSVSGPLVDAAAEQVRTFFDPDGAGAGSLRIREASVDGRTIRVVFDGDDIDVIFLGGWEEGAFGYDSSAWALSDLVDGGYIESIITSRFGATSEEVRPALAAARGLIEAG